MITWCYHQSEFGWSECRLVLPQNCEIVEDMGVVKHPTSMNMPNI